MPLLFLGFLAVLEFQLVKAERITFQNSTTFDEVIYFTFPWSGDNRNRTNYWDVEMQNLFYNFTVKNNQTNVFIIVTPSVDWNRLCQDNCYLNKNVSYMSWELWGVYVKSVGRSSIDYTVIIDYGFQQPEQRKTFHTDLTWLWITLGSIGFVILIIAGLYIWYISVKIRRSTEIHPGESGGLLS